MKKHNAVKVVLITMLVFMLLTWILPAAYYSSEYVDQGRVQMGLFDLFNYPLTALSYFGYIALFVLVVGGFYGILYKIPAYRSFLDKIVAKFEGKEKIVLSVIMILLAVITSICGLQLGLVVFFPMLVSIILLMGYDKIVAALTLVGSTMIGIAGTTFAYSNTSIILSVLSLDITSEMFVKVIILIVGLALLILNTILYIKKSEVTKKSVMKAEKKVVKMVEEKVVEEEKKDVKTSKVKAEKTTKTTKNTKTSSASKNSKSNKTTKSTKGTKSSSKSSRKDIKAAVKDEDVIVVKENMDEENNQYVPTIVDSAHKVWPLVVSFSVVLIIMILAFIPWSSVFKNTAFESATTAVTEFELFGFPLFGKLLGTVNAFGAWTITDLFFVLAVVILVLVLIYKIKLDDVIDGFISGAKKAFIPAVLVILIYTCLVLVTYHPFQLVIYKAILGLTKGFNVFTSTIVAVLASLFNSDPSYAFQSVLPYLTSVVTNSENYSIIAVVFQSIYGLTMLVAPTSLILMGVLSYLGVSYKKWLKTIWKLVVEFLVVLLIIFTILVLI